MKKFTFYLLFIILTLLVISLSLRGLPGNINSQSLNLTKYKEDGPFELSPERGKFALTYSLVEDKSLFFSLPVAQFATPDLGTINGKYVSLFVPGVSFIVAPGYIIGKHFGLSQVGTYSIISIFAVLNTILIIAIANRFKVNKIASAIAALTFLFATPAFAYAVSLYQHHISTFLILLSIYILIRWKNLWSLTAIWLLCFSSILVDYPNLFLMLPIGFYALGRLLTFKKIDTHINISFKLLGILTFVSIIIPLSFFLWFNKLSYGNPFQLSGTIKAVKVIDENGKPLTPDEYEKLNGINKVIKDPSEKKTAVGFFKTRNMLNGLYVHLISPDRGIAVYTPVLLLSIIGAISLYKREPKITALLASIIAVNIILYSMWSDPWGGWAFGSRYLIPSYAIMSIFAGITLTQWRKNTLFLLLFLIVFSYSTAINTLGAITSNRNPPKGEALSLSQISGVNEKYTFERNLDYLKNKGSKSFIFQTFANKYLTAWRYYLIISTSIVSFTILMLLYLRLFFKEEKYD